MSVSSPGSLSGGLREYVVVDAADVDIARAGYPCPLPRPCWWTIRRRTTRCSDQARLTAADTLWYSERAAQCRPPPFSLRCMPGARVIAAASSESKRKAACELGAVAAIDFSLPDWREALRSVAPEGVDVVLDPVGANMLEPALLACERRPLSRDRVCGRRDSVAPINLALLKNATLHGVDVRYFLATGRNRRGAYAPRCFDGRARSSSTACDHHFPTR